jgi:cytochrome c oxidase subunit 4
LSVKSIENREPITDDRSPTTTMHDSHATTVAGHEPDSHHAYAEHAPRVNYQWIFILLCICTAVSVIFDLVPLNRRTVAVWVLAVAVAKAQFVMRYFMHLKFEGKWKFVLLLPTAILACGIPLALAPDIGLHYYTPVIPQVRHESTARGGHEAGSQHPPNEAGESAARESAPAAEHAKH